MRERVVLIGAGSAMFTRGLVADLLRSGAEVDLLSGEHEQVTGIVDSIRHERGAIVSANLPNTGQVPNLPRDAIVEGPAVADGSGLRPIAQRPLPSALVGTLATRYMWVETVVEAALEGSREKFVQALVLDGAAGSLEMARALADELLAAQAQHLPWVRWAQETVAPQVFEGHHGALGCAT
jgi:alpha-galactosidase/6-phospho-beta-glucosidase family protein